MSQIVFVYLDTFVFAYASGLRKTKPIWESNRKTQNTLSLCKFNQRPDERQKAGGGGSCGRKIDKKNREGTEKGKIAVSTFSYTFFSSIKWP